MEAISPQDAPPPDGKGPPQPPSSVCSNSDTKHEFKECNLLETFIYFCIVKCGHWRVTGFFHVFLWIYLVIIKKKVIQGLEAENCNSTKARLPCPVSGQDPLFPTYPVSHIFGTWGVRLRHPTSGVRGMFHWEERYIGVECCEEN